MVRSVRTLLLLLGLGSLSTCAQSHYTQLYATKPFAPSFNQADVANLKYLGATVIDNGINFGVYSEHATKLQVLLFDDPNSPQPSQQFDLVPQGAVWNLFVAGIGLNQAYGFVAWGPNWPYDLTWTPGSIKGFLSDVDAAGNRFNPNKLLVDPYARMVTGSFNWAVASAASGPERTVSTFQAAGKALTVQSLYQWSPGESAWITARENPNMPGHRPADLIVYEMHPKGFTASPASSVKHPGTFRGIGEKADYFKDLGITAVELLPSWLKSTDGGYWGYDTVGFFIPELTYASLLDPNNPQAPIDEFKWMVDQLHQRGIEVLLDVVYNHTGEGGLWRDELQHDDVPPLLDGDPSLIAFDPKEVASVLEWRGFDNQAYYGLAPDNQTYWDNSGVGQDTRANHAPFRQLIMDSLHYWVTELHVDGFRFDEAAVLGEPDTNYNGFDATHSVLQDIADDPLFQAHNIRLIAEPWSGGGDFNGSYPASTTLPGFGWGEWNGPFRDYWRSLANCDGSWNGNTNGAIAPNGCDTNDTTIQSQGWTPIGQLASAGFELFASDALFRPSGRKPPHAFNFVTIHDGFTMYDLLSYDKKQNACGPLNPACCGTQLFTSECNQTDGIDTNISRNWGQAHEDVKREIMRDLFVDLLVSHGTPLLLGGDEWMRTQLGNNNAYSQLADNADNWFDWGSWEPNAEKTRMHDFVRQLTQVRKQLAYALAPGDWDGGAPVSWEDSSGQAFNWQGSGSRHLAMHYPASPLGPEIEILFNMESGMPQGPGGGPLLYPSGLPVGTGCPGGQVFVSTSPAGYDNVCACGSNADCPSGGICVTNVCQLTFALPPGNWVRLVDTQTYFDEDAYFTQAAADATHSANISVAAPVAVPGNSYTLAPRSIVILENTAAP